MNNLSRGLKRILSQPNNHSFLLSSHQPKRKQFQSQFDLYQATIYLTLNNNNQRQFSIQNKKPPFQDNISDHKAHQIYVPTSSLKKKIVFRGGKALIYKIDQFDAQHLITLRAVMALNLFTLYSFGTSVAKFRIIRSCFWGALSAYFSRTAYQTNRMFATTIKQIHLCDDGQHVEITFLDDSSAVAEIRQISRLSEGVQSQSEDSTAVHSKARVRAFREHQDRFGVQADAYLPILIGDELYALDLDCSVPHKEILNAITKGLPIKTDLMEKNMLSDHQENLNEKEENEVEKQRIWVDITNIQRKQSEV